MKKAAVLALVAWLAFAAGAFAAEEGEGVLGKTTIGGHVKFTLYDQPDGISAWGGPGGLTTSSKSADYKGPGFKEAIIYISQEITDAFSLEFSPSISVKASTGATPKFYAPVSVTYTPATALELGIDRAVVKYNAPYEIEVTLGVFKPVFTMDYGHEMFWEEEYNGGKFICDPNLGVMHDMGVEIYRNFSIWEVEMPVYLYALNNSNYYLDVNNQPAGMVHIEPAYGPFKLSASFAAGRFDSAELRANTRWSVGGAFSWKGIHVRGEFARGKWERDISGTKDALAEGYYVMATYKPFDWLKLFYNHDSALHNFNSYYAHVPGSGERYITNTAGLDIFITDASILQFQVDVADWRRLNGGATLVFTRPTLGLRVTF